MGKLIELCSTAHVLEATLIRAEELSVTLDKCDGDLFGIDVQFMPEANHLVVANVKDTALKHGSKVEVGDIIVEVNGVRGLGVKLMEALSARPTRLDLVLRSVPSRWEEPRDVARSVLEEVL